MLAPSAGAPAGSDDHQDATTKVVRAGCVIHGARMAWDQAPSAGSRVRLIELMQ